ncbi:DUF3800 domain-containing protein [Chitinophaga sp.]|uniref:DUF3800 domain-containing protein n=1 Tax=Chitinophaga sp. TaxID=1869181 RepID=UPI00260F427E|nr:DUF3800 domain-containing protein [uncultured Chitinophaga sp.]
MEIEGVKRRKKYYFIDESGDPNFYDKEGKPLTAAGGYQPYFIVGMVETFNRIGLKNRVKNFIKRTRKDVLYNAIPSIAEQKDWYVHARRDHPEVRINFIELLRRLRGILTNVVIIEKDIEKFTTIFNGEPAHLYREALRSLFESKRFEKDIFHVFCVSQFGNNQMSILKDATKHLAESGIDFQIDFVSSKLAPEMSVIDYMLWMIHRKLIKGESRFFNALRDKFGVVVQVK